MQWRVYNLPQIRGFWSLIMNRYNFSLLKKKRKEKKLHYNQKESKMCFLYRIIANLVTKAQFIKPVM